MSIKTVNVFYSSIWNVHVLINFLTYMAPFHMSISNAKIINAFFNHSFISSNTEKKTKA